MGKLYEFKTSAGNTILPVADAEYITDDMSGDYSYGQAYVEFYSDSSGETPVTPGAGTLTFYGSPIGNIFIRDDNSDEISASTVSTPNATYTPPQFTGLMVKGKVVLAGITTATHCRISIWRDAQ